MKQNNQTISPINIDITCECYYKEEEHGIMIEYKLRRLPNQWLQESHSGENKN